jgi:acetyl/propionyl-CoA carboxylase alpha subunit
MTPNEKTKLSTIAGGVEALAAIEAAIAAVPDLERLARAAEDLAARTKAGRDGLANAALVGLTVKANDQAKADKAVADADTAATVARDALEAGRKAVADLEAEAVRLLHAERDRLFREAADRRIRAALELDRLGAEIGRVASEFAEAGAALSPLLSVSSRLEQQRSSLQDRRAVRSPIPAVIQQMIVQTGSAAHQQIGERERALWS